MAVDLVKLFEGLLVGLAAELVQLAQLGLVTPSFVQSLQHLWLSCGTHAQKKHTRTAVSQNLHESHHRLVLPGGEQACLVVGLGEAHAQLLVEVGQQMFLGAKVFLLVTAVALLRAIEGLLPFGCAAEELMVCEYLELPSARCDERGAIEHEKRGKATHHSLRRHRHCARHQLLL